MKWVRRLEVVSWCLITIGLLGFGFVLAVHGTGVFGAFGVMLALASVVTGVVTLSRAALDGEGK